MIISHEHRYLFVEIPHTGSTAIREELCEYYGGQPILWRHGYYSDFLKIANPEEREYFVFCGIRNPMDITVTQYFKMFTNHNSKFTDPKKLKRRSSRDQRRKTRLYKALKQENIDFQTYFLKYYHRPYNSWASLVRGHYHFLIRFENLQEDFAKVIQRLGLESRRPLPIKNATQERKKDFWSYYTPEVIPRAKRVFGPFMMQWGYEFPPEWGETRISWLNRFEFQFFTFLKKLKWVYFRSYFYFPQK